MSLQDFDLLNQQRYACRAFTQQRIDQEVLQHIFTVANQAPSNCNTQPWHTAVISGKRCDELRKMSVKAAKEFAFTMDFPYDGKYEGIYQKRQHQAAQQLYEAMGISREDKSARGEAFMRNFAFFDAPYVAFIFLPEEFGLREAADVGMYCQNLMLALSAAGLASCPQTALSFHAKLIREQLLIKPSLKLLMGISFGYADTNAPANNCQTTRANITENVQFFN